MISYLIDLVLFAALVFTSYRVTAMYRELVRLRGYQSEFASIIGRTTDAFDTFMSGVRDFNTNGVHLVDSLSLKIDEARETLAELERRASGADNALLVHDSRQTQPFQKRREEAARICG